jgi:hypothetical protein
MRCAKLLAAMTLSVVSFSALANNTLRSAAIKKSICDSVEYKVDDQVPAFSTTKCLGGTFNITRSVRDPRTNTVTIMDVSFNLAMNPYTITGNARLNALLRPDETGRMVQTWAVQNTQASVVVSGDIMTSLNALFAQDGEPLFDIGNGDYTYEKIPGYTLARAKKDLEERLENDSCEYETSVGTDYVLEALSDYDRSAPEVMVLLEQASKSKKIKGAVAREYSDGESEYCSHYYYTIIFTDGTVLAINIDQTT